LRPAARPANGLLDTTKALAGQGVALPGWRETLARSRPAAWPEDYR